MFADEVDAPRSADYGKWLAAKAGLEFMREVVGNHGESVPSGGHGCRRKLYQARPRSWDEAPDAEVRTVAGLAVAIGTLLPR